MITALGVLVFTLWLLAHLHRWAMWKDINDRFDKIDEALMQRKP